MSDPTETPTIGFDLSGPQIPLDQLLQAADALLSILREVDAQTTERAGGALNWVVAGLSGGSAHIEIAPQAKDERTPIWAGRTVVKNVGRGMALIAERAEKPAYFTDNALRKAQQLRSLVRGNGITRIELRVDGTAVEISHDLAAHAAELVEGKLETIGSVEGTLETISVHGQPYFNVFDAVTGRPIRCHFPQNMLERAKSALGKRVLVRGMIHAVPDGKRASMRAREVEVLPDGSELPTVEMMRGILNHG